MTHNLKKEFPKHYTENTVHRNEQPQAATTNIALLKAPVYTVVLSTMLCYTLWHTLLRELEQQTTYSHLGRLNWDC